MILRTSAIVIRTAPTTTPSGMSSVKMVSFPKMKPRIAYKLLRQFGCVPAADGGDDGAIRLREPDNPDLFYALASLGFPVARGAGGAEEVKK